MKTKFKNVSELVEALTISSVTGSAVDGDTTYKVFPSENAGKVKLPYSFHSNWAYEEPRQEKSFSIPAGTTILFHHVCYTDRGWDGLEKYERKWKVYYGGSRKTSWMEKIPC